MKKSGAWILIVITALFAGFLGGVLVGRSICADSVEVSPLLQQTKAIDTTEAKTPRETIQPTTEETTAVTQAVSAGKVNINTATLEELDKLPGIGPVIAQRIIDYRKEHGGFETIYDLANVSGIGAKKLSALLDLITVEDENEDFSS